MQYWLMSLTSFIQNYLLSTYYMPASFVLRNVITAGNKTDKNLSLLMSKERQEYN